eukprot:TRINITY_DN26813_c0_g1_i1.p1 TRINITY_DN26813_c0_g1~~TRINITY_DN26813_c0_g1_i1.p1  ORF type:complete len:289 (+),score=19.35 TRINITY_DN26813_c0_g1_i1:470-1336(+)
MVVVGAFIVPHGAIVLDPAKTQINSCQVLHDAMKTCFRRAVEELDPSIVFVSTPHGHALTRSFGVYLNPTACGDAEWDGEWKEFGVEVSIDQAHSRALINAVQAAQLPVEGITSYSIAAGIPLRWGEAVPLWFLRDALGKSGNRPRYIVMSMPSRRTADAVAMIPELCSLGETVASFLHSLPERVVVMISGDLAHTHQHDHPGQPHPYPASPTATAFDSCVGAWVETLDETRLMTDAAGLVQDALSCGFTGFTMLAAMLRRFPSFRGKLHALEHPTYYGMMVASFVES